MKSTIEIKLQVPISVAGLFTEKEIIFIFYGKAFSKMEYYRTRKKRLEEKYRTVLITYKTMLNSAGSEDFEKWDDLLLWEGYDAAFKEWEIKYNNLKQCLI